MNLIERLDKAIERETRNSPMLASDVTIHTLELSKTEIERLTAQVERMREHLTGMMEAAANYVEPTTYIARHPDLSTIGDCLWVREFPEPDQHQSVTGKYETRNRRDQAFICDMIYMLDGPEQRAALSYRGGD